MSRKEQMPKDNKDDREKAPKDIDYNPDITSHDKEILNNQSKDVESAEGENDYFKDREEPIDYAGADLDLPEMDDKKFNQTRNEPDDVERNRKPKESVNSNDDMKENTETIAKGEKAEKFGNSENDENPDEDRHLRKN